MNKQDIERLISRLQSVIDLLYEGNMSMAVAKLIADINVLKRAIGE